MSQDVDLQRLVVSMEANFKKYERALYRAQRRTEKRMKRIEDRVRKAGVNIDRLLGGPLAGIGAALGTRELARYADAWTATANKLKASGEEMDKINLRQRELADMAIRTRTAFEPIVDLYARIRRSSEALGVSQEQVARVTEITAMAFKTGGAAASEQAAGILQLSQAIASGFLQGDELRSIRENAPVLAQAIADYFHVTIGELKKLGAEGKITSRDIVAAIEAAGPRIEAAYRKTASTMAEAAENLKTATIQLVGELDRLSSASGYVSSFFATLGRGVKSLADSANYTNRLADAAERIRNGTARLEDYNLQISELNHRLSEIDRIHAQGSTWEKIIGYGESEKVAKYRYELKRLLELRSEFLARKVPDFVPDLPARRPAPPAPPVPERRPEHQYVDHYGEALKNIQREIEIYERRRQLIGATAAETARANMQAEIMNRLAGEHIKLSPRQEAELAKYLDRLAESVAAHDLAAEKMEQLREIGQSVASSLESAFSELARNGKIDFKKMVNAMIADLMRLVFQMNVIRPLFGASGSGGVFGSLLAGIFHSGGLVGAGGPGRAVSPALFAGAPRYHAGGVAGLRPGEIPAILQKGEIVIPRGAVRMAGGGGQARPVNVKVNIHAPEGASVRQRRQRQADGGFSLDVFIEQVENSIGQRIVEGRSAVGQAMQSRYGLDFSRGSR